MQRHEPYDLGLIRGPRRAASEAPRHNERPAAKRSSLKPALLSGIAGFILGAVFWHFVGFWSFVSQLVLKGPAETEHASTIETGSLPSQPQAPRREMRPTRLRQVTAQPAPPVAQPQPGPAQTTAAPAATTAPTALAAQAVQAPAVQAPAIERTAAADATTVQNWTVEVDTTKER